MMEINLNEIFMVNKPVKTKVSNYPEWIYNEIINIDKNVVQMQLKPEYLKLLLTIGDTITIKSNHNGYDYTCTGFVENITFKTPPTVFVKIENVTSHKDLRKFVRWDINLLCKLLPENEDFKIQGITTDISESGISMISYADFNIKDTVDVEIITLENEVIRFKGKVKRLHPKGYNNIQYGIEIIEIDAKNKSLLKKIISKVPANFSE